MRAHEIELVLKELKLEDSFIQQISQPEFSRLYFQIYRPGTSFWLRLAMGPPEPRIYRSWSAPAKNPSPKRFLELLRSRIRGGKIVLARQLGHERVIELKIHQGGEEFLLYFRLWAGAANSFLCTADREILDCQYRRPGRKEQTGEILHLPEPKPARPDSFPIRQEIMDWAQGADEGMPFNRKLHEFFSSMERTARRARLKEEVLRRLRSRENALAGRVKGLESRLKEYEDEALYQRYAEVLSSQLHLLKAGMTEAELEDYWNPGQTLRLPLDARLKPQENAEHYYSLAKKARLGRGHVEEELSNLRSQLTELEYLILELEEEEPEIPRLEELKEAFDRPLPQKKPQEQDQPGLEFQSQGFRILVGRSAKENDAILRRQSRGNDFWLHTRDYPGAYVFIRTIKGKTIPLDVLLDAGNLAVFYSKARNSTNVDLYYTQVKYLRRPKDGKLGLVLPTQEKNLSISPDKERLDRLLRS